MNEFPYCTARDGWPNLERCRRVKDHFGDCRFYGREEDAQKPTLDLNLSKEWCEKAADLEESMSVGAGRLTLKPHKDKCCDSSHLSITRITDYSIIYTCGSCQHQIEDKKDV